MAPLPSRVLRPRGGHGIEWQISGEQEVTKKGRGARQGTEKTTKRGARQGTKKRTTTSNTGVKRKRAKKNAPVHLGGDSDNNSDDDSEDGSDADDVPVRDKMTMIEEALLTAEGGSCWRDYKGDQEMLQVYSRGQLREEVWKDLIHSDPSMGHLHPKDAIRKLVTGKISEQSREKIAAYVRLTVRDVFRSLLHLVRVPNWDGQVAQVIVDIIQKNVREHLGVEVKELEKLVELANEVKTESNPWQVVKGDALKNSIRDWACNLGHYLTTAIEKWAKEPKGLTFSCSNPNYRACLDQSRFVSLMHSDP